ncbi:mechanosensitive ion channel family protein [Corynebacterium glyciniphilum]|uniref:mechanosensitive ion channel family protein n=1 Tax=Corynebacterium glyciniphilum TaxID=1404244 RepID=UPI00264E1DC5|nr:mechanosensitive ion channel family protein [Corynebacterium glyciniphilum]MDN6705704.1 mechanosensitive ion channel [Corynebacterium glyciniphilum]
MFDVRYLLFSLWDWIIQHGLPLSALLIIAILIPRIGRQVVRVLTDRLEQGQEETKAKLALVGALVYMLEIVGYFVLVLVALTNLGVPAMGAAIPATVVSAAIGFGSQNIIGDFLSGFFIISERHYGVGDVVTFDDTAGQITGTVVKLTLRSTQIRTVAGELVTVPNSKASVTINYSQKWSRAVVDLDVPMVNGESMADLLSKVEDAASTAVESAGVDASILGDIEIQPARNITPPAAAGQPWSVGMRVGVDTGPADQWLVERAIRANLVNTFWDRYQSPGEGIATRAELNEALSDKPADVGRHSGASHGPSTHRAGTSDDSGAGDRNDDTERVIAAATAGSDHMSVDDDSTEVIGKEGTEGSEGREGAASVPDPDDPATEVLPSSEAEPATGSDDRKKSQSNDKTDLVDLVEGPYESKTKNVLSFGGRFRPSTSGLFIALVIVGLLALFSSNPDDADQPGILSPDRWRNAGTEVESTETPAPSESDANTTPDGTEDSVPQEDPTDNQDSGQTGDSDTGTSPEDNQGTGSTGNTGSQGGSGDNSTDTGGNSGNTGNSGNSGNSGNTGNSGSGESGTDDTNGTDGSTQNQGQGANQQNSTDGGSQTTAP